MNLKGTGAQENESEGVAKTYDFSVKFKQPGDGEKKPFKKEGEDKPHGQRKRFEKGKPFGAAAEKNDDDDFETVVDKRKQKPKKRFDDDSDSEKEGGHRGGFGRRGGGPGGPQRNNRGETDFIKGANVQRGGNRGGRGGFRNENKE